MVLPAILTSNLRIGHGQYQLGYCGVCPSGFAQHTPTTDDRQRHRLPRERPRLAVPFPPIQPLWRRIWSRKCLQKSPQIREQAEVVSRAPANLPMIIVPALCQCGEAYARGFCAVGTGQRTAGSDAPGSLNDLMHLPGTRPPPEYSVSAFISGLAAAVLDVGQRGWLPEKTRRVRCCSGDAARFRPPRRA
jgi:hypothetical protein